jgi:hypothetical protein
MNRVHDLNQMGGQCEEIARLKAEVEELKSQPDPLTAYLYADTLRRDDIKTLKAHIDRLTKAGDAMNEVIRSVDHTKPSCHANHRMTDAEYEAVQAWKAAKEGKQSK